MWKCLTADRYDLIVCGTNTADATNRHSPTDVMAEGLLPCRNVETAFDLTGMLKVVGTKACALETLFSKFVRASRGVDGLAAAGVLVSVGIARGWTLGKDW